MRFMRAFLALLLILLALKSSLAFPSVEVGYVTIIYVKGGEITEMRALPIRCGSVAIPVSGEEDSIFLTLDSLYPYSPRALYAPNGTDILKSEACIATPRYVCLMVKRLKARGIYKLVLGKDKALPPVGILMMGKDLEERNIVLPPLSSREVKIKGGEDVYAFLVTLDMISTSRPRLSIEAPLYVVRADKVSWVNLTSGVKLLERHIELTIFSESFRLINKGSDTLNVFIRIKEVNLEPLTLTEDGALIVKGGAGTEGSYLFINLPNYIELKGVKASWNLDPLTGLKVPVRPLFMKLSEEREVRLEMKYKVIKVKIAGEVNDSTKVYVKFSAERGGERLMYVPLNSFRELPPPKSISFPLKVIVNGSVPSEYEVTGSGLKGEVEIPLTIYTLTVNLRTLNLKSLEDDKLEVKIYSHESNRYVVQTRGYHGELVCRLLPGNYTLIAEYEGVRVASKYFSLHSNMHLELRCNLTKARLIVKPSSGGEVEGLKVLLTGGGLSREGVVDSEGRVELGLLPLGSYRLRIEGEGGLVIYEGNLNIGVDESIVPVKTCNLMVSVKNILGYPLSGVEVTLIKGGRKVRALTDDYGSAVFKLLPPGRYLVRASVNGIELASSYVLLSEGSDLLELKTNVLTFVGSRPLSLIHAILCLIAFISLVAIMIKLRAQGENMEVIR